MVSKIKYIIIAIVGFCVSCASVSKKLEVMDKTEAYISDNPITTNSHASTLVELKPN